MRKIPSWSQKIEASTFPADFCNRIFIFWRGGGVSRYATIPLIVALSPGHSDITRFRPWSPIARGYHLDRTEKIPNVAQTTGTVDVFDPRSGISGSTSRRASACPHLHEWWTQPAHVRYCVSLWAGVVITGECKLCLEWILCVVMVGCCYNRGV